MSGTQDVCGIRSCGHAATLHSNGCDVSDCLCGQYIPASHFARNIPDAPDDEQRKRNAAGVATAKIDRLRRQLGAVIDSDLLVARLMAAMAGDPMIQSRVIDLLLHLGLQIVGRNPVSFTQPTRRE